MKASTLFKQTLLFLLILLAANEGFRQYFLRVTAAKLPLVQRDKAFHNIDHTLDYLFVGHSRVLFGIDTTNHPEIFSFSSGGESNIYSYYKLKHILEEGRVNAKTIVMPCGFGSFNMRKLSHTTNSFYWSKYVDYLEIGSYRDQWFDYLGTSIKAKLFPYFERPAMQMDRYFLEVTGKRNHRLPLVEIPEEERAEMAFQSLETNHISRALYDSVSLIYLEKTVALCKEKNQKIVFVKFPITSYAQKAATRFTAVHELKITSIDSIILNTWSEVPIIDHQELYIDQPDLFVDVTHMNEDGAAQFTNKILKDLRDLD